MSSNNNNPQNTTKLIICDTNVVAKMFLFKASIMFTADYSFGSIEIDTSVIEELQNWINKNNSKLKKFGLPNVQDMINYCNKQTGRLKEPSTAEMTRSKKTLANIESKLPSTNGSATSNTDKRLLTMAWKHKAHLVTMDLAVRQTALRSLPSGSKLLSFYDLAEDLFKLKHLSINDITSGLEILAKYNEDLDLDSENKLKSLK